MATRDNHYDVVIIGSGAGGATIAHELAATGKKILILERGGFIPRSRYNWDPKKVFVDRIYRTDEKWLDKDNKTFHPNTHYWVGGNTTFYGAALFRFRPGDFEARQHAGGVSPAWPIRYEDLAPYYLKAEKQWQVHGQRGIDPTEPANEPDYFYKPLPHDPTIANLETHFKSLGWRPSPLPIGVMREENDPESKCIRCETCGGYPCLLNAKADARTVALQPILKMPNVTLLPNRRVFKLETDPSGKSIRRVVCEGPNGWEDYGGDIVVLAAGAVNSAALMLNSTNPGHNNGLANASDQVGRNYMFHTLSAVVSATAAKNDAPFPKTMCLNEFYWGDKQDGYDLPMGHIQLLEHMEGYVLEGQIKEEGVSDSLIPNFIANAAADRLLAFLCISEDLPDPNNRVTLDGERIKLSYEHNNLEGHHRLTKKLDWALDRFTDGGHALSRHHFQMTKMLPLYGTAHMCGTLRFGDDPRTSVLDRNNKAHQLDNLYVTDSSFFPSSAAVNPTLTIVANAMRVADHLKVRLGARAEPLPPARNLAKPILTPSDFHHLAPGEAPATKRGGFKLWPFGR